MSASQLVHQGDRPPIAQALRRFSALLWRRPRVAAAMLLAPPMGWFLLVYVSALGILFLSSFWRVDEFTGEIIHK
ncbi:MAG: hypothetical protein WAL83_06280, partial [Arenicellales bacterium]